MKGRLPFSRLNYQVLRKTFETQTVDARPVEQEAESESKIIPGKRKEKSSAADNSLNFFSK